MRVLFIIIIFLSFNLNAETKESLVLNCQSETYESINKTETKKEKFNQIFIFEILISNAVNKEKENLVLTKQISESLATCYKYEGSATDLIIKMKCTEKLDPKLAVLFGEQFLRINRITGKFNKISNSELGVTKIAGTCKKAEALF